MTRLDLRSGDRIELTPRGGNVEMVLQPATFLRITRTITAYEAQSLGAALLQAAKDALRNQDTQR